VLRPRPERASAQSRGLAGREGHNRQDLFADVVRDDDFQW
jgi:hypothetical protein